LEKVKEKLDQNIKKKKYVDKISISELILLQL